MHRDSTNGIEFESSSDKEVKVDFKLDVYITRILVVMTRRKFRFKSRWRPKLGFN